MKLLRALKTCFGLEDSDKEAVRSSRLWDSSVSAFKNRSVFQGASLSFSVPKSNVLLITRNSFKDH
jgi:hypothetical protein